MILVLGSAGNGACAGSPASLSSACARSIRRRTIPVAPTSRVLSGHAASAPAQERAQADEVEEAQLAEVDDTRR